MDNNNTINTAKLHPREVLFSQKLKQWLDSGTIPHNDRVIYISKYPQHIECESIICVKDVWSFSQHAGEVLFPMDNGFRYHLEQLLFAGRLMFNTIVEFRMPYFFVMFDGTFYKTFKQFFENTFLPLYKQHIVFDGSLCERADLEYIIVFQRYPYWLEINVYFTVGCAFDFDKKNFQNVWFDLLLSGYFLSVRKEEILKNYSSLFNIFIKEKESFRLDFLSVRDLRSSIVQYWNGCSVRKDIPPEWSPFDVCGPITHKTVFDTRGRFFMLDDIKKYGKKKAKRKEKRFLNLHHDSFSGYLKENSSHFPKELIGLSVIDIDDFTLHVNNKIILRRYFCGLASTEYLFATETFFDVRFDYDGLGILKRFEGSNYFNSGEVKNASDDLFYPNLTLSLLDCPDWIMHVYKEDDISIFQSPLLTPGQGCPLPWYAHRDLVHNLYNNDLYMLNDYQHFEFTLSHCDLTRSAFVARWINMMRRENLYGDWFSPFLPHPSSWIKCNQIWFGRKVRTTNFFEGGYGIFKLNNSHFFSDEEFYSTKYGPKEYKVERYEELEDPYMAFVWFKENLICPVKKERLEEYEKARSRVVFEVVSIVNV